VPAALPQGGVYPAAATDAPDISKIGWRDFFVDDRLRKVIQLGLDNNQDLRLAAANVLQARAQYRGQRANLLPTLGVSGSGTYTNTAQFAASAGGAAGAGGVQDVQSFSVTGGITSFEIDLFGRLRNLSQAAQEQYFASSEAQRATRVTLIGEIASAWLTLASDREQLAIAQQTLKAFEQSLELTRAQFRIGTASELESRQAETSYESARNDVATAQTRIAQDINALQLLTGACRPSCCPRRWATARQRSTPCRQRAVRSAAPPTGRAPGRTPADRAERQYRRGARGLLPAPVAHCHRRHHRDGDRQAVRVGHRHLYGVADRLGEHLRLREEPGEPRLLQGRARGAASHQKAIQTAFREVADALAQRGTIDEQVRAQTARAQAAEVAARLSDALPGGGGFLPYRAGFCSAVPMPPNSSWSPPG
jgi:multidrug efflux system outer membrane protein